VHAFLGRVLLIESELDDICPHQCIQNFADAIQDKNKLTHWVQKGAPHSLTGFSELKKEYKQKVLEWIQ
jgi:dipeptidyl aminopeptidase/acylaminoacyl peptidase